MKLSRQLSGMFITHMALPYPVEKIPRFKSYEIVKDFVDIPKSHKNSQIYERLHKDKDVLINVECLLEQFALGIA